MKKLKINQLWATRLMLGIAIALAFGAGYGFRAQVNYQGRWLPPSQRLSAYLSLHQQPEQLFASSATADQISAVASKADSKPYVLLDEVRRDIENNFYERNVDETQITYGAIRGMLASLGDRFTRFMTPDEYQSFQVNEDGQFVGIGASISTADKYVGDPAAHRLATARPLIVKLIDDGPAQKAGLRKDDVLLNVAGHDTANMSLDMVVAYIRGESGTPLKITVERKMTADDTVGNASYKIFNFSITRKMIEVNPVHLHWLPQNIAWVQLDEFNKKSDEGMTRALAAVQNGADGNGPAKGLIIDMRNNPGGLLDSVVAIASRFVLSGPIVFTHERTGEMRSMDAQKNLYLGLKIPIVVLVNNYSASAAEILTGALKDNNLAKVVGEHTYGKASVQVLLDLSDGGALAITTAHYLTPAKHDISNKGITPDVIVKASAADKDNGRGDQLHRAMAIIVSAE
ncbi:MAG: S41 family peptidase [Abditibacteriaceae bacterium]